MLLTKYCETAGQRSSWGNIVDLSPAELSTMEDGDLAMTSAGFEQKYSEN